MRESLNELCVVNVTFLFFNESFKTNRCTMVLRKFRLQPIGVRSVYDGSKKIPASIRLQKIGVR